MNENELYCAHGIGHYFGVHGCDGCCYKILSGKVTISTEKYIQEMFEPEGEAGSILMEFLDGSDASKKNVLRNLRTLIADGSLDDSTEW
jgi:hypothetical protein